MRIIIRARGWTIIDLDLLTRIPPAPGRAHALPGPDPRSTVAAQIEQADEPAPGFGFAGQVRTIVSRDGRGGPGAQEG